MFLFGQGGDMYDGVEVDLLSLGDADCIIVTKWHENQPHRILIDGACSGDADIILEFLLSRNYRVFWAAVCSHAHNDHASGLIKIIRHPQITIHNGWMHDIRNHVDINTLRRAAAADTGVNEVVETTKELSAAFSSRYIRMTEPFAGECIAGWPDMKVLGPSRDLYREMMQEVTKLDIPALIPPIPSWAGAANLLRGNPATSFSALTGLVPSGNSDFSSLAALLAPPPKSSISFLPLIPLAGALSNSSVKQNPTTQPFNETSTILGVRFGLQKLLFTADAGSRALAFVSSDWNNLDYCGVPHHGSDGNFSQEDIERFCPKFAFISAKGDSCHPSRAIVSGLVKVGAKVASTHKSGNLWYSFGNVPLRADYQPVEFLTGTGQPEPLSFLAEFLKGRE
jgi:beta-lactamase superfamily II metal-dependent hydrolase